MSLIRISRSGVFNLSTNCNTPWNPNVSVHHAIYCIDHTYERDPTLKYVFS